MSLGLKVSFGEIKNLSKNKNFLKFWIAQISGQIGVNFLYFYLLLQIFTKGGNNFLVGLLIAVLSLPSVFLSPIGGVLSDSFNRKQLLFYTNIFRVFLVVIILFLSHNLLFLFVIAFLVTSASQIFVPTEQSSIPDLVDKDSIYTANSVYSFSVYLSFLIGYSVAGFLWEYTTEFVMLVIVGGLFLNASFFIKMVPDLDGHIDKKETILQRLHIKNVFKNILDGMRYIYEYKVLSVIIILVAFIFAVERSVIALVPDLLQNIMGFSIADISFFAIIPLALGTVAGAFAVNKTKHKHHPLKTICIGLFLDAVALFFLSFVKNVGDLITYGTGADSLLVYKILVVVLAFVSGFADVLIIVSSQVFVHLNVGTKTRGRVFAGFYTLMNTMSIPLVLLISYFSDVLNTPFVLFVFGILSVFGSLWGFVNYRNIKDIVKSG